MRWKGQMCGFVDSVGIQVMKLVLMKLVIKLIQMKQAVVRDFDDGYNVVTTTRKVMIVMKMLMALLVIQHCC